MTHAALLTEARAAGVTLWREGEVLCYRGPSEVLAKLLPALKAHKPDILEALATSAVTEETSDALWGRVTITEPGGRTIEVDTPSGWTLGEWAAYAAHYHGPPAARPGRSPC